MSILFSADNYIYHIYIYISVKPIYTQSSVKLGFAMIATRKDEQSIATVANKIKIPKDIVMIMIVESFPPTIAIKRKNYSSCSKFFPK